MACVYVHKGELMMVVVPDIGGLIIFTCFSVRTLKVAST